MMRQLFNGLKRKIGPKKEKTIFIFYLCGAAALAIFVIIPSAPAITAVSRQITAEKVSLRENRGEENSFKETLSSYRLFESKAYLLNRSVMNKNRNLEFITALEDAAEENNLDQKITVGNYQNIDESGHSRMPLQLALRGSFTDELKYLQTLEKMPIYFNVTKLTFNAPAGGNANDNAGGEKKSIALFITSDTFWQ